MGAREDRIQKIGIEKFRKTEAWWQALSPELQDKYNELAGMAREMGVPDDVIHGSADQIAESHLASQPSAFGTPATNPLHTPEQNPEQLKRDKIPLVAPKPEPVAQHAEQYKRFITPGTEEFKGVMAGDKQWLAKRDAAAAAAFPGTVELS
jgi:hypothetical protein